MPSAWRRATASRAGSVLSRRAGSIRRAAVAAGIVSEHAELWVPGSLSALSFLGWLPFLLAVVTLPSVGDLGFFVSAVALSPSFPINAALLAGAVGLTAVGASVLAAMGEAILLRSVNLLQGLHPGGRSLDEDAARLWLIQLVAALPGLAAAIALLVAAASAAPGEYQSPDLNGGPFLLRLARDVWPFLVALVLAVLTGQAFGAAAQRASINAPDGRLASAIWAGLRGLGREPIRRIAIAAATDLALTGWLVATWALLRVLWTPIGRALGTGTLLSPTTGLLLIGFVAIWLCLVAAGGAMHAWSSTWWSLEVDASRGAAGQEVGARPWT